MTSSKCNDDNTIQPRDVIVSINDKRNQSIELRWVLSLSLSLLCLLSLALRRRISMDGDLFVDWYVNYSCFYSWLVFNYRIDRERIRYMGVLIGRNFDQRERESYTRELDELIQDRARLFSASFVPLCAAGFSHYVFYLTRVHTHVCTLGVLGKMFFDVD